jgi:O-antigen ligase
MAAEIVIPRMASETITEPLAPRVAPEVPEITRPSQAVERWWLLAMLLPGALTAFLAFRSGGFYLGATSLAAAEMALVVGLRFALARRPLQGVSPALIVAVVAMGCLAGWTLLSASWSDSVARAYAPYSRVLLYGLVLLFFGMLPFSVRRVRWMVYGLAIGIVVVCGVALVARLLPDLIFDPALAQEPRLGYPLTYWNALGILACVGTILCAHLACSTRDHWIARIGAAAALPMLTLTLYYTLSRGAIWGAAAAVAVYVVVGRPRGLLSGAIASVPPVLIALAIATPADKVSEGYPLATEAAGNDIVVALLGCMAAAAVLRAALLPLDAWFDDLRLPRLNRPVAAGVAAGSLLLVLLVAVAAGVPGEVQGKYEEFTDRSNVNPERGESRLFSARAEGRFDLWDISLASYREDRLRGSGAGTFETAWNRDRPSSSKVEHAHSLYMEVLGELGIVGLLLLATVLVAIVGAFAYRARGPDRPLFAALLAAALAWGVHAGVDWDWQMPAVTLWLFALGGAALSRPLRRRRRRHRKDLEMALPRIGGVIVCLVLALLPARLALSDSHLNDAIDDVARGDCAGARVQAASAIDEISQRPTPYQVIAFCDMREGRYRSAVAQMSQAVQHDPHNWELNYGLALARASAGLEPGQAARRAAALNPNEKRIEEMPPALRGRGGKAAWKRAAAELTPVPPDYGDA